ncbi:MAG: DUF3853 family protein [Muribaculaceae bacterium]|nr:DUF3853 family protein [Muribaculaceae bacterium]
MLETNFDSLKKKPVAMMTGEELATLVADAVAPTDGDATTVTQLVASLPKYVYGIKGIAELFGCSVPTANRIKRSGIINDAITQIGRKIIVDAEKALILAAGSKCNDSN